MNRPLCRTRRVLLGVLFVGSGMLGASGVAAAQYTDPPPANGPFADPGGDPGARPVSIENDTNSTPGNNGGGLPVTGGDVLGLVLVGSGAVAAGSLLVGARRRFLHA